jgi:diguanylate cyclase (GGDEF)-like protein
MSSILNPRDRFIRQAALLGLILGALGSGLATVLHRLASNPAPIDLVIPPLLGCGFLFLLVYLYLKPESLAFVLWSALTLVSIAIVTPAWFFTCQAALSPEIKLVETLPPITSIPLSIVVVMFIFVRPRKVLIVTGGIWILAALPILLYLVLHPKELSSPRGLDMAITLGPVMAMVLLLIPFHRGVEHKITSLQSERSQLQILSERDPLTQLYNRRAVENSLADFVAEANQRNGIVLFDIDHFKSINDRYGHGVGDIVLRQVAERCAALVRRDDLLARWGGEEFLLLIQGVEDRNLYAIAEDLRYAIASEPIEPVGTVTASFGVTQLYATDSVDSLLKRVDEAMYAAKGTGRNRVVGK